jgi:hypothetical protein
MPDVVCLRLQRGSRNVGRHPRDAVRERAEARLGGLEGGRREVEHCDGREAVAQQVIDECRSTTTHVDDSRRVRDSRVANQLQREVCVLLKPTVAVRWFACVDVLPVRCARCGHSLLFTFQFSTLLSAFTPNSCTAQRRVLFLLWRYTRNTLCRKRSRQESFLTKPTSFKSAHDSRYRGSARASDDATSAQCARARGYRVRIDAENALARDRVNAEKEPQHAHATLSAPFACRFATRADWQEIVESFRVDATQRHSNLARYMRCNTNARTRLPTEAVAVAEATVFGSAT